MIHGLFIGNNYPDTSYSLPDCVLDAEHMLAALGPYMPHSCVYYLKNADCTLANIAEALDEIAASMCKGDALFAYNSGHGTTDGKRQGIVLADGVIWWEANIRKAIGKFPAAILVSDSCFSGGLSRGSRERFVPIGKLPRRQPPCPPRTPPRKYDYISACSGKETADSTGTGGAFTNVLLDALDAATPRTTIPGLYKAVRRQLPNAMHPQTPQLFTSDGGFARRTLGSFLK